jgi:prepilin-type N-terminal cleavage/methylation domain-containing protein
MTNYEGMSMADRPRKTSSGFTIAELLIALAITALLLVAVTAAFNASIKNYCDNEDIFKAMNNARQALTRMTNELRTAGYYDSGLDVWLGVVQASPNDQCEFYTPDGDHIIYEYRDAGDASDPNTLMLITGGNEYTLCDDVTAASFTKTPADGDPNDSKSVVISLTVQAGSSQQTLSAAVVIRRSLAL